MSFLKIKDPSKIDAHVAEYIKTKNKIQNDFCSERLGEQSLYEDFGKIFEPMTEQQKKSSEEILSKFAIFKKRLKICLQPYLGVKSKDNLKHCQHLMTNHLLRFMAQ